MVIFSLSDGYLYSSTNTQLFFVEFQIIFLIFFQWSVCHCWLGRSGNIESRFYEALNRLVYFISNPDCMALCSKYDVLIGIIQAGAQGQVDKYLALFVSAQSLPGVVVQAFFLPIFGSSSSCIQLPCCLWLFQTCQIKSLFLVFIHCIELFKVV